MSRTSAVSPDNFTTFGDLLKHLRKQAGLTQLELSIAVGYSDTQISRMEQNQRVPDAATLTARFVPALQLEHEPEWVKRLLDLAADARPEEKPEPMTETSASVGPSRPRHNLPVQLTSFIGREKEISDVQRLLTQHRLTTLTGSGGVGKTRLSLRVAEAVLDDDGRFVDGVFFVGLAPLTDPELVPQQIAVNLGLRDEPGRPILEALTRFLQSRQLLLIIDNCEHLLEACARLADELLRACPNMTMLASSREPLGVGGEAVFVVPSLPFPVSSQSPVLGNMQEYASMRLFIDRARLVRPDYELAAHNVDSVARICQRLDGIPLALELAAARLRLLDAATLAGRLDDVFRVLTGGSRMALPRQQTLRATIDWSYGLLSETEQLLLQRVSVFAGGCTLEAAEAVCSGEGLETGQILDTLDALIGKSMVIADRQPGEETRYRLLETVRQYAREKLQDTGDGHRLRTGHRDYFLQFAETCASMYLTRDRMTWMRKRQAEEDNFRLALEWSFSDPTDLEAGPRLVGVLFPWRYQETIDWSKRAVAWCQQHASISMRLFARVLVGAAQPVAQDDPEIAFAWMKQSVELGRSLGAGPDDQEILSENLYHFSSICGWMGDIEEALAALAESEDIFHVIGPTRYTPDEYLFRQAYVVQRKAELAVEHGRYQDAKTYASQSIRLLEEAGDAYATVSRIRLGVACTNLEEYDQAREIFLYVLSLPLQAYEAGYMQDNTIAYVKRWLTLLDLRQGNLASALMNVQSSLQHANRIPDYNIIASDLGLMAALAAKQGQSLRAARLSGAAQVMYAKQKRRPWEDSSLDTLLPGCSDRPESATLLQAFEQGQAMHSDEAVAYALGTDQL